MAPTPPSLRFTREKGKINVHVENSSRKINKNKIPTTKTIGGQRFSIANLGPSTGYSLSRPGSADLILEKTETFSAVASTGTTFQAKFSAFHPGSPDLGWLQNMSNSFSSYSVLALEFTYVPAVPTTTAGAVAIAFQEDPLDNTPTTMGQMLTSEQAMYCPVYAGADGGTYLQKFGAPPGNIVSFTIPPRCIKDENGAHKVYKMCKGSTLVGIYAGLNNAEVSTAQMYSPGKLIVATEGVAAGTVGQVFVRYRIKLMGPINISNQV